jgi:hypothetical protein
LRSKELTTIIDCAEISHVFCDKELEEEMHLVNSDFLKKSANLWFMEMALQLEELDAKQTENV